MPQRSVCFFAPVSNRQVLERVEFYNQDIEILRRLGFDVTIATGWNEIPWNADLYFVWWWTWAFLPLLKSRLKRRPVLITGVFDHHWPVPGHDYDHRPPWQKWLLRYALQRASANVFVSQVERDSVCRELGARNPVYIPLVLDTQIYSDPGKPRENTVVSVAWLHKPNAQRKGIPNILRAIPLISAGHPEVRFVIAGEHGSAYSELLALAEQLRIAEQVSFPGLITKEQKIEFMRRCKVYLQPSEYEGFGLAILEAMSCGAAVVGSPVGAVPEVVGDAGLLVDCRCPETIAAAVNRVLDDESLRRALGERGRHRAERLFPFERRRRELGKVINLLLEDCR